MTLETNENDAVIDGDRDGCDEIDGSRVQSPPEPGVWFVFCLGGWPGQTSHIIYTYITVQWALHNVLNRLRLCCIVKDAHTCVQYVAMAAETRLPMS